MKGLILFCTEFPCFGSCCACWTYRYHTAVWGSWLSSRHGEEAPTRVLRFRFLWITFQGLQLWITPWQSPASWHFPSEDAEKSEQEQELWSAATIKPLHPRYPNYLWSKAEWRMACQSQLLLTVQNRGLGISWTHRQIPLTIGLLSGACQYGLEKNSSPGYLDLRYGCVLALL